MSFDYSVAVHAPDWPTPAALNRCMTGQQYPVRIIAVAPEDTDKPLKETPGSAGLVVSFEGATVELEASIERLGGGSVDAQVPKDFNRNLRELGVRSPDYKDGDYVLTLSFRTSVPPMRAGAFLMAGLIKCANGLGYEFQSGTFGTTDFANGLAQEAADPSKWK